MKKTYVIIIVICIACAIGITFFMNRGQSEPITQSGDVQMLCSSCGHSFTFSPQEYEATLKSNIQKRGSARGGDFECPKCSKVTAQKALKCPKCENVFIPDWGRVKNDFPDRCPKCRFSEIEQEQKKS
jgi:hypothetical protein